ncbi:hypothetical protein ONZ45_g13947 [Pleurotus djamor]|nr:hypothetical protein ONZ45_g13947 [Pleurotus djamor]
MSDTHLHDVALDEQYMDDQSTAAESRCEKTRPVEGDLPTGFVNKLSPPAGTDYWRCQSFMLLEDYELGFTHKSEKFLFETLTWRIDAYVYVVNSKPDDPNFSHNGGAVYVVLVHSGPAERGDIADSGLEYRFDVVLTPLVRGLGGVNGAAMKQLPALNIGTKNGDVTNYPLSFVQDMQMFRSKGNETFTFSAQYEDSVDIRKGQQPSTTLEASFLAKSQNTGKTELSNCDVTHLSDRRSSPVARDNDDISRHSRSEFFPFDDAHSFSSLISVFNTRSFFLPDGDGQDIYNSLPCFPTLYNWKLPVDALFVGAPKRHGADRLAQLLSVESTEFLLDAPHDWGNSCMDRLLATWSS